MLLFYYDMENMRVQQAIFFKSLLLFYFFHSALNAGAQYLSIGNPPIRNFSKKIYAASPQNWQITQRNDGVMLFANNLGLLSFDGNTWKTRPLANHTIMRSIRCDSSGRIFVGGQGEFGYFDQKSGTVPSYNDLTHLVPESGRQFADVWNILIKGNKVFFQTFREVMVYDGHKIRVYNSEDNIEKMFYYNNSICIQYKNGRLAQFVNDEFKEKDLFPGLKGNLVDVTTLKDGRIFIATYKNGVFRFDGKRCYSLEQDLIPELRNMWISSMRMLSDGNLMFGTSNKGLILISPELRPILMLSKQNGLQNSTILAMKQDKHGDLWAASESGIDFIEYKSPYRIIYPDAPFNGTGYSAAILNGKLYLGTNNGLYSKSMDANDPESLNSFAEVPGSRDVCWNLDVIDGELYLGHNEGASVLGSDGMMPLFRGQGVWKFMKDGPDHLIFGAYEGIGILKMKKANYGSAAMLPGFAESSRILVKDKDDILWMSHPYRGIYRFKIDKASGKILSHLYGDKKGLETYLDNYVIYIDQKVYASNTNGIFYYDGQQDRFHHDTVLENIIGFEKGTKLLLADRYNNIWYRKGVKMGFLEPKDQNWKKVYFSHLLPSLPESLAGGFEKVFSLSENEFLFNCESGFLLFDKRKLTAVSRYNTSINKLILLGSPDSVLIDGIESVYLKYTKKNFLTLSHDQNNLRFEVASNCFNAEPVEYNYTLEEESNSEINWTSESFVSYNNLVSGKYILKVRTRIGGIEQPEPAMFYFEIVPAWYNSNLFRIALLFVFAFGIIGIFQFQNKKFESEKSRITREHQEVVDEQATLVAQSEKEIIELKNEQLIRDISFKNTELASIAMHLAHKKDFITTLEQELKNIQKNKLGPGEVASNLKLIIHRLQQESILDEDWERFTHYFDELHMAFINRLKEKFPDLTNNDHKLCAYLRMNLSTKEIAALNNISPRGVEGSRYRLRKKMGLSNDANLNEYMNQI